MDRTKAHQLAQGLLKCASVSDVPGFISRGVGSDGKCHYSAGSIDQTLPWFYGLYNYLMSEIPTTKEHKKVKKKIEEVINALMLNDWRLPCDGIFKGQYRDNLKGKRYLEVTCYLYVLRAMYNITYEDIWLKRYQEALFEEPVGSDKTRAEICAAGYRIDTTLFRFLDKEQLWIYVKNQATLAQLADMEKDKSIKKYYLTGLAENVNNALEVIDDYKKFDNNDTKVFGHGNWRGGIPGLVPSKDTG